MLSRLTLPLVLLAAFAAYLGSLDVPFLWDDRAVVPVLLSGTKPHWAEISRAFLDPFWVQGGAYYYRPLVVLSFHFDAWLHGDNPAGFHLTNLLLHLTNVALLYVLIRRSSSSAVAGLLSLLFALAPRLVEAVAWISGRTDLLAATWVLAALVSYRRGSSWRELGSAACLFLGILSKEVAIAGFVALVALERVEAKQASILERKTFLVSLATALGAYLLMRGLALGIPTSDGYRTFGATGRTLLCLESLGRYSYALGFPFRPQLLQGVVSLREARFVSLGIVAFLAVLASFALGRRRLPPLAWPGLLLSLVGLGLVVHLVPLAIGVVSADRLLYVPLLGLTWALGVGLKRYTPSKRGLFGLVAVSLFLLVGFAGSTLGTLAVFQTEGTFWLAALKDSSAFDATPTNELGNVYSRAGLHDEALRLFRARTDIEPERRAAMATNAARTFVFLERYEEARRLIEPLCDEGRAAACRGLLFVELATDNDAVAEELVRRLSGDPESSSLVAWARELKGDRERFGPEDRGRWRSAALRDRRGEALRLAQGEFAAKGSEARPALEYWLRFARPVGLSDALKGPTAALADSGLWDVASVREAEGRELLAIWPRVEDGLAASGTPSP